MLEKHITGAKARVQHLAGLQAKTDAAERKILEAAQHRAGEVEARLKALRPRIDLDTSAADTYQELTLERGQLALVIAQAQQHLGAA